MPRACVCVSPWKWQFHASPTAYNRMRGGAIELFELGSFCGKDKPNRSAIAARASQARFQKKKKERNPIASIQQQPNRSAVRGVSNAAKERVRPQIFVSEKPHRVNRKCGPIKWRIAQSKQRCGKPNKKSDLMNEPLSIHRSINYGTGVFQNLEIKRDRAAQPIRLQFFANKFMKNRIQRQPRRNTKARERMANISGGTASSPSLASFFSLGHLIFNFTCMAEEASKGESEKIRKPSLIYFSTTSGRPRGKRSAFATSSTLMCLFHYYNCAKKSSGELFHAICWENEYKK